MSNIKKYNPNQQMAIELLALDPGLNGKQLAKTIGVDVATVRKWLRNPDFIDIAYKRYMEVAGIELPQVIKAMVEEAKMGNVQAGRLVLEQFGKLENKVKVQIESPFEKFIRMSGDQDAEFVEVTNDDKNMIDNITNSVDLSNIELPERDESNDHPLKRRRDELLKVEAMTKAEIERKKEQNYQKQAYQMRKRAKAVGLDLLPSGRQLESARRKWKEELEQLEIEKFGKIQG